MLQESFLTVHETFPKLSDEETFRKIVLIPLRRECCYGLVSSRTNKYSMHFKTPKLAPKRRKEIVR